jgi:hypothetical protein
MRTYTKKELKNLVTIGAAEDITAAKWDDIKNLNLDRVGICSGVYGISGGLLKDADSGALYAVTARNSMLLRLF